MTDHVTVLSDERAKKDAVKRQLLADMRAKHEDVMKKISQFMRQDLRDKEDYVTLAQSIIDDVDSVLQANDYESSLFLRNTVKPLKKVRQDVIGLLEQFNAEQERETNKAPVLQADMMPVYVLLFQQQGHNMQRWTQLLDGLERNVLGRPVYEHEEDAAKAIRLKMTGEQEGYVKVAVPTSAIRTNAGFTDRFGSSLLSLAPGSIRGQHILEFVHGKKHYHFLGGELVHVPSTAKCN